MEIKEYKEITVKQEEIKDIICNACNKSIYENKFGSIDGCKMSFDFEYGSAYDGDLYIGHLCDKCYEEFIDHLKIKLTQLC